MSAAERFDDPLHQEGWSVQPTQHAGEYLLSHDGVRVRFHEARFDSADGLDAVALRHYSDAGTATAAEITLADAPWRIETWLRELAAETAPEGERA